MESLKPRIKQKTYKWITNINFSYCSHPNEKQFIVKVSVKILQNYWKFFCCHNGVEKRQNRAESYDEISRTCWDLSQMSVTYYAVTNHLDTQLPRTFPESFLSFTYSWITRFGKTQFYFPYGLYDRNLYSEIWKRSTERLHTNDDFSKLLVQAINSGLIPVAPSVPRFLSSCNLSPSLLHTMLPPTVGTGVNLWLNVSKSKVSQLGWRDASIING